MLFLTQKEKIRLTLNKPFILNRSILTGLGNFLLGLFLLSLSSCQSQERLQVVVFDTYFCPKKIRAQFPSVIIETFQNFQCPQETVSNKKYHGHWVLSEFLQRVNPDKLKNITLQLHSVFGTNGYQRKNLWQEALKRTEQETYHLMILAVGHTEEVRRDPPSEQVFVASGSIDKNITKNTKLWPQIHGVKKNIYLVGSYSAHQKKIYYNYHQLNRPLIEYYFPDKSTQTPLTDTSLATAIASAKAVNLCYQELLNKNRFNQCLEKNTIQLPIQGEDKTIPSY